MGVLLGGGQNETKTQMQAVLEFETKLANITTPSELRRDEEALYNLMTIKELQELAGFVRQPLIASALNKRLTFLTSLFLQIDWRTFFENAMKVVNKKINAKEQVVVYAPEYLSNLTLLIKEYNETEEGRM